MAAVTRAQGPINTSALDNNPWTVNVDTGVPADKQ